jgi:transcriptional regulator with XRE-family HTH domain
MKNRIKELRKREGLTQKQLAKILKTTQQSISQYESSIKDIPLEVAFTLADYFCVNVSYLVCKSDDMKMNNQNKEVLTKYLKLSHKNQKLVLSLIDTLLEK